MSKAAFGLAKIRMSAGTFPGTTGHSLGQRDNLRDTMPGFDPGIVTKGASLCYHYDMSTVIYYTEVNLICIISLALLLGSLPRGEYQSKRGRYYKIMVGLTILMSAADLVSGVFRGASFTGAGAILWFSNGIFLISTVLIGCFWVMYSMQVLSGKLHKKIMVLVIAAALLDCALICMAPLNGWIYTIDEANLYHRGSLVMIHWVCVYALELIPSVVAPFTKAERQEKKAITLFIILPMIASVVQSAFYGVTSGQVGLMGGMILLYIMLQNREVNEARVKAALLSEISNTDTLTGLRNRRAYENEIELMKRESWTGVIFMDLNGLKQTNDTQGHKAGDAMICRFAQLLRDYYRHDRIFRISGDEFVVLCKDRTIFDEQYRSLRQEMGDQAAAGFIQGPGADVVHLINEAEKLMYQDKNEYYIRTGKERRVTS